MEFSPVVLAHLVTALGALVVGGIALGLRKGTQLHRLFGRVWVGLMVSTALISFGIKTHGHYSWIHLLSVVALAGVTAAIFAVVRGNIRAHRRGMLATYISLVIAGTFALLPNRQLGHLVWHAVGLA